MGKLEGVEEVKIIKDGKEIREVVRNIRGRIAETRRGGYFRLGVSLLGRREERERKRQRIAFPVLEELCRGEGQTGESIKRIRERNEIKRR